MIYEYIIHLQSYQTYCAIECENLDEADAIMRTRFNFPGRFFSLKRVFTEKMYEQLEENAREKQSDLEIFLLQDQKEPFDSVLKECQNRHAILFDKEKKIVRVYPTLDPLFERSNYVFHERKSHRIRRKNLAQIVQKNGSSDS